MVPEKIFRFYIFGLNVLSNIRKQVRKSTKYLGWYMKEHNFQSIAQIPEGIRATKILTNISQN